MRALELVVLDPAGTTVEDRGESQDAFTAALAEQGIGVTRVQEVASVGDTALDLQAGYNAGVRWNVGVLSGAHDRLVLESMPHTHLLPSVAELPGLWPAA